ncbi:MAG: phosphogluconate dehydratase [Pseudomonadota bacterium]|nr:phosphogluconate dehydratase [Pseudomonadota bacterium]
MTEPIDCVASVTERIRRRSHDQRQAYLDDIAAMESSPDSDRRQVGCSNMAHAAAAAGTDQDQILADGAGRVPNIGIITAYNDMLSAHQPFEGYPQIIRAAARGAGGTAQVAGGVPAMCDGVTQGRPGMELSLMSRDVIAMATAVGLSHGVYDAALCLGVCDKIVPGLVIGALSFGHLPVIFVPAGPMTSGLPNDEKASVRKAFARGEASREDLLKSEVAAYHGPGTCTFYGTANSNQMLMEVMGLHLPGSAFVNPHDDLRHALTVAATERAIAIARGGSDPRPISRCLDERSFVNAIVGLHATGGSTNHTLHLPAMAAAAGITLTWEDFADLSEVTPLLARVYPNGKADVNHFHAAGGMGFVIRELLKAGLLDGSAMTVTGSGLIDHACEPVLTPEGLSWRDAQAQSLDPDILRPASTPHAANGGLRMLDGNLGKAVVKISAVAADRHVVEAPAAVFTDEASVKAAYNDGALNRDVVVVVRGQGPRANGMPELHSLTPMLANLQDQGFAVALVTDGRMSGASGTVPAAIHVSPEAVAGGAIGRVADGDMIRLDARAGTLSVAAELSGRPDFAASNGAPQRAFARPLFSAMRAAAGTAEQGAGLSITET